jgi:hypothetical protein
MTTVKPTSRATGIAALYLAAALVAAMIYFLLGTDYPTVTDGAEKVDLLVTHHLGIQLMYLVAYIGFGLVLAVLALGLDSRLSAYAATTGTHMATAVGLIWAVMLIATGLVYNYGMGAVVDLHSTDPAAAVTAWQAIEPVALGLGGAGGEILGGTWVLLVSTVALKAHALPKTVTVLGLVVGSAGIVSTVPGLSGLAVVFGLLIIIWLASLAVALLREHAAVPVTSAVEPRFPANA